MEAIQAYVSRYKPGSPFDFELKRKVARKSDPMRKYYFAEVVSTYAEGLGYEVNEYYLFHTQLKFVYFNAIYEGDKDKQPYIDNKGIMRNIPSVFADDSELDVSEKKKFLDWVVRCAGRDGIYIKDPE